MNPLAAREILAKQLKDEMVISNISTVSRPGL